MAGLTFRTFHDDETATIEGVDTEITREAIAPVKQAIKQVKGQADAAAPTTEVKAAAGACGVVRHGVVVAMMPIAA